MTRKPAEVFPPSDFIKEEMDARGWSREALAEKMGSTLSLLDEVLSGKHKVNVMVAYMLSQAFGTSAQLWIGLQKSYDERLRR